MKHAQPTLVWRLDHRRRRKRWKSLTVGEKELLALFQGELEDAEEFDGCELYDVIDNATDKPVALFALWPFGSGVVIDLSSNEQLATVVQHVMETNGNEKLRIRLGAAYAEAQSRLGIAEAVDLRPGGDPIQPEAVCSKQAIDAALQRFRARLVADPDALRTRDDQNALQLLLREALEFERYRPVPARRVFELSERERAALELIHAGAESDLELWFYGFPNAIGNSFRRGGPTANQGPLARWLGHSPPLPLDETMVVDGQPHPIGCLLHDAIHEVREVEEVLQLMASLPVSQRADVVEALFIDPSQRLTRFVPANMVELRKTRVSKPALARQLARRAALSDALLGRLGDNCDVARLVLAKHADWATKNLPQLRQIPTLVLSEIPLLVRLLYFLVERYKAQGRVPDLSYDPLFSALALSNHTRVSLPLVLALLPAERAENIAPGWGESSPKKPRPKKNS